MDDRERLEEAFLPGAFSLEEEPEDESALLPAFLREVETSPAHPVGTLSFNKRSRCWVVKGSPDVTEMCKRLFPGSQGSRRGEARFTAHRRTFTDLCWLLQRFPLTVKLADLTRFDEALREARTAAVRKAKAAALPERTVPPEGTFCGELRPFQQEGLSFLLRNDRCLLADEMGLGKTVEALAYLAASRALPVLVVPPPHLTLNWERETSRFLRVEGRAPRIHIVRGLKPYELPEADMYIMHYLLLRGWKDALPELGMRCVIFDEVQELRHGGTEKYSAASLLS